MAKFKGKDLKLGTDQSVYFGNSDQARLWFDGAEWAASHTISGTAATAGHHLIRKDQVDSSISTLSGTLTSYIDDHTWTESDITDLDKYTQSEVDTLVSGVNASIITDHGGLTGLSDDDHTQYIRVDGFRAFTSTVGGITPVVGADLATKDYVDSLAKGLDWQDSVLSRAYSSPPTSSGTERYIITPTASGTWAGNDNGIAQYNGSGWDVTTPNEGFATWVEDEDILYVFNGTAWVRFGSTVDHGNLIGLSDDDHPQYLNNARGDARYYTQSQIDTISGTITNQIPSLTGYATESYVDDHTWTESDITDLDKYTQSEVDSLISAVNSAIITDHGALTGLGDDDHTQYILVDGARGFTATVSGVYPTESYHLSTMQYVDDQIETLSSGIVLDHGSLTGLGDDDHTQYILVDGSRGFTATVSGVSPAEDYDLATKGYVDSVSTDKIKSGRLQLSTNDNTKSVTFGTAFSSTNYTVSVILSNTTDASPSIYPMIVSAKETTGFSIILSGEIDSNNYYLEWICHED
jgi:S-adenosylmethionine/arginine decarboxylase-like enzyme